MFGLIIILTFILGFFSIVIKKNLKEYFIQEPNYEINITSYNKSIEKVYSEEIVEIQNYMDLVLNGTVLDKDKIYYP